jgi:FkbM family methyltransferase
VKRFLKRLGDFMGDTIAPRFPSVESTLNYLKDWGFSPSFAIDVGAYHAEWALMLQRVYPQCHVWMIEPLECKASILRNKVRESCGRLSFTRALLGADSGRQVVFSEMETGSSVFEELSPYSRIQSTCELSTLDSLMAEAHPEKSVDILKLDVQGYELEVLKGSGSTLSKTEFILLEASLIPTNVGAPTLTDIFDFLTKSQFTLLDICSFTRRKDCALWQTDLLFISNSSGLRPTERLDTSNWG